MPRSVNAVASRARRKKVLKQAKGFFGRRKNVWTVAKNAVEKAMQYAYRGRKEKKRSFRLPELTLVLENTECLTLNLWELLRKTTSSLTEKFLQTLQ